MLGVRKAVITAAGLGTRLLPTTKEIPKEMLPIFTRGACGELLLKPLIQLIFEQLFDVGIRDFFFIVGRGKRAIEDHFTIDSGFLELLREKGKDCYADELESFYRKIDESNIVFLNQPEPKGFGDAVLRARNLIDETFMVHAGDTYIVSEDLEHIKLLFHAHERWDASATLLVMEVANPRPYGVVGGELAEENVLRVGRLEEKPEEPWSKLAILPLYVFETEIFDVLAETPLGKGGELQLTDGIAGLLKRGGRVMAVKLPEGAPRLDIGNPEGLWEAMETSYKLTSDPYFKNCHPLGSKGVDPRNRGAGVYR
ncbi:MAG: hypothetical protein DRN54_01980 [Thaumarchaeota archaeon]|nr:MAG: hypothetical protein DRN54_01980 [Nitrososphaerota archaeon]